MKKRDIVDLASFSCIFRRASAAEGRVVLESPMGREFSVPWFMAATQMENGEQVAITFSVVRPR